MLVAAAVQVTDPTSSFFGLSGLTDGVIIAIIGAVSGASVALIGAVFKMKSESERLRSEMQHQKAVALDQASKDLRESMVSRLTALEQRADAQWETIRKLMDERAIDVQARIFLLDVLLGYPDPPGAPPVPGSIARAIGYEPRSSSHG